MHSCEPSEDGSMHSGGPGEVPPAVRDAGFAAKPLDREALLEQHRDDVAALRAAVSEAAQQLGQGACVEPVDDHTLLAFLRATGFSVPLAQERLQATAAWRQESRIEAMMCDDAWRDAERGMRHVLLYDYLGLDQHGRPVLVERVGAWDVSAVLEASQDLERFCSLHAMAAETMARIPRPAGAVDCRGYSLIMDMAGLGLHHLRPRLARVFAAVNNIDEQHYPDSVSHIFVVNAPSIFAALYRMIKPVLNSDTSTRMHCSAGLSDELLACLGPECVPKELGGALEQMFPYHLSAPLSEHPATVA